ncbi:MAG: mevalonate kinase family protein [Woeseiaceae bacterium]
MLDIQTSAPGKVIVTGEYAVLEGAPAVCMAVDRRAHVSINSSDNEFHSVFAPGYSETVGRFRADETGIEWVDGGDDYGLFATVWRKVAAMPSECLNIVLDSNEFVDVESSSKIGIGSSAALTVALTAALDIVAGGDRSIHRVAAAAHSEYQGGAGSGADVACSLAGGVIEYRMGNEPDRALRWPDGLAYALLWSGVSANTRDKLKKLAQTDAGSTNDELVTEAEAVASAWHDHTASDIIAAVRSYTSSLRRFDDAHALGIFEAGHAELASRAASCGVVYKPCGAGGGDIGIAIANDAAAIEAFVATASDSDFKHLRMTIEPTGLRRDGDQL